jgi:ABC-type glycerol-3-phosphate transport system permease component
MNTLLSPSLLSLALAVGLFLGILACLELGYRAGRRTSEKHPEWAHEGIGVIEAAIFALLGLLLGFSFSGATSRLDTRRQLIVQEANAIGTAYLRLDELHAAEQPEMRRLFRDYLDARLRVYEALPDLKAAEQQIARASQLQLEIWSKAIAGSRVDSTQNTARLLLPALNEMMDVTTSRTIALHTRLPSLIFALLIVVALLSGLLAGYAMAKRQRRSRLHMLIYAGVIALTVYVVLDLDDPRAGFIRLDTAENALVQLRDSIR